MEAFWGNKGKGGARWHVMRDLKRANAKEPAYKLLGGMGMEVFVPMEQRLVARGGRRVRQEAPFMPDLLFVRGEREDLDPVVERVRTLQYRWMRGAWREPMTVADGDMGRFIHAVRAAGGAEYYRPGEIAPGMLGRLARIVGGPLDGCSGRLLAARGAKRRRLMVEIPGLLAAAVEVSPEYITFT